MGLRETNQTIKLKEILYLTDFSFASEQALPFAMALARQHTATIRALHVIAANRGDHSHAYARDELVRAETETAKSEMHTLDSKMHDISHHAKLLVGDEAFGPRLKKLSTLITLI